MGIAADLIKKYSNSSLPEAYQNAQKQLQDYLHSKTCTKKRPELCLSYQGTTALSAFLVFRFLMLFYEPYGHYNLQTCEWQNSTDKTVDDVVKSMQADHPTFLKILDNAVREWLIAITQDAISYSLRLRHPMQKPKTPTKQKTAFEKSYLDGISSIQLNITDQIIRDNKTFSQLISEYKEPSPILKEICSGLEAYVNLFLVEDQAYSKSDAVDDYMAFNPEDHFSTKELLKARKYAWHILQLFPVAVFASINMAKNQRPCVEALNLSSENSSQTHNRTTRLKQGLKRFERIGMLLGEAIRHCFHPTLDSFFRENQIKFIQTELKSPDKLVRWTVREKNKTESSPTTYSVRFYDENQPARKRETDPYAHAYKEITENSSLKSDAKAKQIERPTNAYEVFKYLLDLSMIDYEATNETLSLRPNRTLNWMVFEQLTGFLTIADYDACYWRRAIYYADYASDSFRGSNFAYQLRNMEINCSSFGASKFLESSLDGYFAPDILLSEFIKKTSLSFSDIPLRQMIFDTPSDYICWVSEMMIQKSEQDRIKKQLFDDTIEISDIE